MTDDSVLPFDTPEESRRSVMKKSALAAAGTAAASGAGVAAAQDDDDDGDDAEAAESQKAILFTDSVRPRSDFVVTSPVIRWNPNVEEVRDNVWSDYNTRMIRYLGTGERATIFVAEEAELPEYDEEAGYVIDDAGDTADDGTVQPEVFTVQPEFTLFDTDGWLTTINFTAVGEDEEDDLLDNEDWWLDDEDDDNGTGTATDSG
ncbi:hypothetical protein [Halosimplex marinum]|uniref:hypothetical protein n=1 Tax=Halosimplex marinum TaxID=3396620 RepID=UPI003F578580